MKNRILIVDDEPGIRSALTSILEDERYQVFAAEDAVLGLEILEKENISLVFLGVLLPRMGGIEALDTIQKNWPWIEVVMISGHATVDMVVRAVKLGAFDFLEKPLSPEKVLTVCRNALILHKRPEKNRVLKKITPGEELIGASPEMEKVKVLISQAAVSEARILISGENGTGKEIAARTIHRQSPRADKPFVEVNCAAIPETLIESELFGHEKGAFTDAAAIRKGRFETANGGTLFLDEIGDMSLSAQAKVLRAIQEQKIERLGGEKTIDVDVRILAATNKDLEKACAEGSFRQDLFFRLNVIPIRLPPLRERKSDIPLLLSHFLEELIPNKIEFEDAALGMLNDYSWPGNIRELKNFAERIAIMYTGGKVGAETTAEFFKKEAQGQALGQAQGQAHEDLPLKNLFDKDFNTAKEFFEKYYLEFQLFKNYGIISKTAEVIGLYPSNLLAKLKKYGIAFPANKD